MSRRGALALLAGKYQVDFVAPIEGNEDMQLTRQHRRQWWRLLAT